MKHSLQRQNTENLKQIFSEMKIGGLSPNTYIHVSFFWAIYIFPRSVCLFCCRKIGGPILGIFKSLTETWMWKLRLRPRSFFSLMGIQSMLWLPWEPKQCQCRILLLYIILCWLILHSSILKADHVSDQRTNSWTKSWQNTDKKENQIFLIYREIQSGAVAKSYMTNGLHIYGEIFSHFLIY